MALIKPTSPEQWQALAAALELISASAAMLSKSARSHCLARQELATGLDGICTLADAARACTGLPKQVLESAR